MRYAIVDSVRFWLCCLAFFVAFPGESLGQGGPAPKGDITAVNTAAGSGLSGGETQGDVNLRLLDGCNNGEVLKRVSGAWACAADAAGGGTVTSLTEGTGIDLTPNTITTTGSIAIDTGVVPRLGVANTFTANQAITGSLTVSGNIALPNTTFGGAAGVLMLGGNSFLHNYGANAGDAAVGNTFVGRGAGNFFSGNTAPNTVLGNTGIGFAALSSITTGTINTGVGYLALGRTTTGFQNVAVGLQSLFLNETGTNNVALGMNALFPIVDGGNNIAIGSGAGSAGGAAAASNQGNIYIGSGGSVESHTIRIGDLGHARTFISGINGVTTGGAGAQVVVDVDGQLGTISSSRRFKYDIQNMETATDKLLQLRPVTFRYKQGQKGGAHPLQYGLIAEEVAEVYPDLVQRSPEGESNTVLYHTLPSMLLNEFQKQHRAIESLKEQLAQVVSQNQQLQAEMATLKSRIGETEAAADQR
jgi:hypothetical protein